MSFWGSFQIKHLVFVALLFNLGSSYKAERPGYEKHE